MTKDEALKLALEALISCELSNYGRDWVWPVTAHEQAMKGVKEAITAIKEALAQTEPWCMKMNGCKIKCEDCPDKSAQPEQKPVVGLQCANCHLTIESLNDKVMRLMQERNFCPRCGKRTADLTTIHTCT
ncbi:hypothetical protein UFOVP371_64, partial [uncultured Caudovirales phage]